MRGMVWALLLLATAASAGDTGLEEENKRLRDELAAMKAGDPEGMRRKAIDEYLETALPKQPPDAARTGYDRGFYFESRDEMFRLKLNIWGQFNWHWVRDVSMARGQAQFTFRWTYFRLRFAGHAFTKRLTYFIELELSPQARRYTAAADNISEAYFIYHRQPWKHGRLKAGRFRPRFTASENAMDDQLVLGARGLVNEFFTPGRSDGLALLVEELLSGNRMYVELSIFNGSEFADNSRSLAFDDKRIALAGRWAWTVLGEGSPYEQTSYEGDFARTPGSVLVVGVGLMWDRDTSVGSANYEFVQTTADITWRRRGTWVQAGFFYRSYAAGGTGLATDEDEWGWQATAAQRVGRRWELAGRLGWIDYAPHKAAGGELIEITIGFSYFWDNDVLETQGQNLRVTVDFGYAENTVLSSATAGWPNGVLRGWLLRASFIVLF